MQFRKQRRVYADAAAATPLSVRVERELVRLLAAFGNPGGLHAEAREAKEELERARASVALSIAAHGDEVVFTSGGTEANNLALSGLVRRLRADHGVLHVITSATEHSSVLEPLRMLVQEGCIELTELPVDPEGFVSPREVVRAIREETALVSVGFINSEVGTVQPIQEIAKVVRSLRTLLRPVPLYLHTDAAQAPLWLELSVERLGVDLMSIDAQKMLGPKGVGVLYARRGVPLRPVLFGGGQERGLRSGTENVPLAGALAIALADAQEGVEKTAAQVGDVSNFLWQEIQRLLPKAILNGPQLPTHAAHRAPNNISITIPGLDGEMAAIALDREGVAVSTRSACDTADENPSHVLVALGVPPELARATLRITLLPSVSRRDAAYIARTLKTIADRYKSVV